MDDTEKTETESANPIVGAAKVIGSAVGKVASIAKTTTKKVVKLKDTAYKAEYLGSGTFKITKPKRTKRKRRQSALKNRQRRARK
jgi:hypothetical protein